MAITLNTDDFKLISLFERITKARVKDIVSNKQSVTVIVNPGEMGFAIGKKGENIKKFSNLVKKRVQVIEYDEDVVKFVKNILGSINADVTLENDKILVKASDYLERGKILGRGKNVLNRINSFLERHNKDYKVEVKWAKNHKECILEES